MVEIGCSTFCSADKPLKPLSEIFQPVPVILQSCPTSLTLTFENVPVFVFRPKILNSTLDDAVKYSV